MTAPDPAGAALVPVPVRRDAGPGVPGARLAGAAVSAEPSDPAELVTQELVQRVARALSACATGRGYRLRDERFHLARAALTSVATDLYACGLNAGRREADQAVAALEVLRRRQVVTTDPAEQPECCGLPRDEDGFCVHRPGHPIAVSR